MDDLTTTLITFVVAVLGSGGTGILIQVVSARRKTNAEATKLNAEVDVDKFEAVTGTLFKQVDDLRGEVQHLKRELEDRMAREWIYIQYTQLLRDHIYSGKPPPPPPWPTELTMAGPVASPPPEKD